MLLQVQEDVLEKILSLLPIADQIRFSAVSRLCREIQSSRRLQYAPRPPPAAPSLPWIVFWEGYFNPRLYCSPSEHRLYNLQTRLSDPRRVWCFGSCHGWLVLELGELGGRYGPCRLILWNPISGAEIQLPMIGLSLSDDRPVTAMSGPPTDSIDKCFMVIIAKHSRIYLLRLGDPHWTELDHKFRGILTAVVFCKGKFYCMSSESSLLAVDPTSALSTGDNLSPSSIQSLGMTTIMHAVKFIVESEGEILLACRVHNESKPHACFIVFKADLNKNTWVRISSLGGRSLFLWKGFCCVSIRSSDVVGCKESLFDVRPDYVFHCRYRANCSVYNLRTGYMFDSTPLADHSSTIKQFFKWDQYRIFWFVPTLRY